MAKSISITLPVTLALYMHTYFCLARSGQAYGPHLGDTRSDWERKFIADIAEAMHELPSKEWGADAFFQNAVHFNRAWYAYADKLARSPWNELYPMPEQP